MEKLEKVRDFGLFCILGLIYLMVAGFAWQHCSIYMQHGRLFICLASVAFFGSMFLTGRHLIRYFNLL